MEIKNLVLDCGEEESFKLADGVIIKNLIELNKSLEKMDDNIFKHHVNEERNDFSSWISDVIKDEKLAEDLLKTKDRNITRLLVLKRIMEIVNEMTK